MRSIATLLVTFVLAACTTIPVSRNQSQAATPGQVLASEMQKPSTDSSIDFLLTAAATDFHAHRPTPTRFRNVHFGHPMISAGAKRYMLCGDFLPLQGEGKAEWIPFATIKTSGYEQYIGGQAVSFCQASHVAWDKNEDLSSALQNRLDSLR